MSDRIEATEGEEFEYEFEFLQDGTALDIDGWTITLFVRDDGDDVARGAAGNRINGAACTISDGPNGKCTYRFTTANLTIEESTERITTLAGKYVLFAIDTAGTPNNRYTQFGDFVINKNPFIAET